MSILLGNAGLSMEVGRLKAENEVLREVLASTIRLVDNIHRLCSEQMPGTIDLSAVTKELARLRAITEGHR